MSDGSKAKEWGNLSSGYFVKKRAWDIAYKFSRTILLFGLCFLILQPLLDKISVSFMERQDLYDSTVISIPRNFTLTNYTLVSSFLEYWQSLFQTFLIVIGSSLLQVAACTLAGYSFARFKFPLKGFWFFCVMLIIVVPPQTIMSSLYLNFRFFDVFGLIRLITGKPINMLNSVMGFFLLSATGMGLKSGLYIFMLRQYFRGMPKELEEAAWVDGCGRLRTFVQIMLPDAAPMLTSCLLFSFVWQWTDSIYTTLFLSRYKMLSNGLSGIADRYNQWYVYTYLPSLPGGLSAMTPIGETQMIIATGMLMVLIPLVLLYLVAQRAFVESVSQTGIKM